MVPTSEWAAAVAAANIPTLLPVLVQLTGDRRWIDPPYRPTRPRGLSDNDTGGFTEDVQAEIRNAALDAILAWLAGKPVALPSPPPELLTEMMSISLGEPIPARYAPMVAHELVDAEPPAPAKVPAGFSVLIIGAGMSGICAAVNLARAGIPYRIIERNQTVGGTWLENRYPGCGVDVPSHLYSFSFAPNEWSRYFALRDEIFGYFERVARDFDVVAHTTFGAEVTQALYDEATRVWRVDVKRSDGTTATETANVVISAVGAFNKPRMPKLPGIAQFQGPSVHTARWPTEGVDLAGKRVAVIGTGASAMQLVPAIADTASEVLVFQRSPQWATPFEKFQVPVPDAVKFLLREMPLYRNWYRVRLSWAFNDRIYDTLQKDPKWEFPERSVSAANDGFRRALTRYIEAELGDRQDLMPKVLPHYPPFGKRILLDNGWYRTLRKPNVHLFTRSVTSVEANGIVDDENERHEADVLVWATGFDVVHFLAPMNIVGRSGKTLHETWNGDDARAFLGTAVPDFPSLFCLYGPNTQFGHGGSLISVVERQMHYVLEVLRGMLNAGGAAVEVRPEVHDEYNRRVDKAHDGMVWTHPGMDTYYRNSKGRVVVNNPFRIIDVWDWTEHANLDDYVVYPRTGATP